MIKQQPSAALYYNLGNAYYRKNDITQAIIAYERALKLSPSDEDTRYNLQLAQAKTIDRLSSESDVFFMRWLHTASLLSEHRCLGLLPVWYFSFAVLFLLCYTFLPPVSRSAS